MICITQSVRSYIESKKYNIENTILYSNWNWIQFNYNKKIKRYKIIVKNRQFYCVVIWENYEKVKGETKYKQKSKISNTNNNKYCNKGRKYIFLLEKSLAFLIGVCVWDDSFLIFGGGSV